MENEDRIEKEKELSRVASQFGRKGGEACKEKHGSEFYKELQKKSVEKRNMGNDLKTRIEKRKTKNANKVKKC